MSICYIFVVPKKTKKEKIIARLRRKLETVQREPKLEVEDGKWKTETGSKKIEISLQNISLPNPTSHISPPTSSLLYIVKDLRKTFFLAGLAISLEIMLYWLWR